MGIKSWLAKPLAAYAVKQINKWKNNPIDAQERTFRGLIKHAKDTTFGIDHNFVSIRTYDDFKNCFPLADY